MDLSKTLSDVLNPPGKAVPWEGATQAAPFRGEPVTLVNAVRFGFKAGLGFILANVVVGIVVGGIYFFLIAR